MVTSDKSWLRGISQTPVCKMGKNDIFHPCGKLMKYSYCINTESNSEKNEDKFTPKRYFGKGDIFHTKRKYHALIFFNRSICLLEKKYKAHIWMDSISNGYFTNSAINV